MNRFIEHQKDLNSIKKIIIKPVNYFDFPNTILAFAHSMKTSNLFVVDNTFIFRLYGKTITLITHRCKSDKEFIKVMGILSKKYKIRLLNSKYSIFRKEAKKYYGKEWYINRAYNINNLSVDTSSKSASRKRGKLNQAEKLFYIDNKLSNNEWLSLFDAWYTGAKKRHYMVIKGHYLAYMQDVFEFKRKLTTRIIPFRLKETNELYGVCGYEPFKSKAQITIMKHRFDHNSFVLYFWFESIRKIFKDNEDIKILYCGTTADHLKKDLGLNSYRSYKLHMENII